jgi:hypothetical protein
MAHLALARAYALRGDTAKIRAAFQDFFATEGPQLLFGVWMRPVIRLVHQCR